MGTIFSPLTTSSAAAILNVGSYFLFVVFDT